MLLYRIGRLHEITLSIAVLSVSIAISTRMPTFIFTYIYGTTFFLVLIYIYPCSYRSSLCFYFVLFLLKDFYIWSWGPCLLVYLHTMCVLHALIVHKRVLDLLELELWRIVSHHVDVRDKILVLGKSSNCFYLPKYSFHY